MHILVQVLVKNDCPPAAMAQWVTSVAGEWRYLFGHSDVQLLNATSFKRDIFGIGVPGNGDSDGDGGGDGGGDGDDDSSGSGSGSSSSSSSDSEPMWVVMFTGSQATKHACTFKCIYLK